MAIKNNTEYVKQIREIVGIDTNQSKLSDAEEKDGIPGTRGIGYLTGDGAGTVSVKGLPGETSPANPDTTKTGTSPSTRGSGKGKGSPSSFDPASKGGGASSGTSGTTSMSSIIDGSSNLGRINTGYSIDGSPFSASTDSGTLKGITDAVDCDSGKALDIRFDGEIAPPEGWNTPTEPGNAWEQFTPGLTWTSSDSSGKGITATKAASQVSRPPGSDFLLDGGPSPSYVDGVVIGYYYNYVTTPGAHSPYFGSIFSVFVSSSACTPGSGSLCPLYDTDIVHPEDGKQAITLKDGKFVSNPYEPAADKIPKLQSDNVSTLNVCFPGGRKAQIGPTADGGFYISETVAGVKSGLIKIFDGSGKVTAYTDVTGFNNFVLGQT